MKRVFVYCEGLSEEAFVNNLLNPYFAQMGIYVYPILCTTSRKHGQFKGGATTYGKIRHELAKIAKEYRGSLITSMFDYYALPKDFPGLDCTFADPYKRIAHIEAAVNADLGFSNLRFNLVLHEMEALLFSEPSAFSEIADPKVVKQLEGIRQQYPNPELINNSVNTAPSKRIPALISSYLKTRNGIAVAQEIGIVKMRAECPHFDAWIQSIISF